MPRRRRELPGEIEDRDGVRWAVEVGRDSPAGIPILRGFPAAHMGHRGYPEFILTADLARYLAGCRMEPIQETASSLGISRRALMGILRRIGPDDGPVHKGE